MQPAGELRIREIQMFGNAQEMQIGSLVDDGRGDHMKNPTGMLRDGGRTVDEAREKRAKLDRLVDYANAIASL
jgi:hypothetical protein